MHSQHPCSVSIYWYIGSCFLLRASSVLAETEAIIFSFCVGWAEKSSDPWRVFAPVAQVDKVRADKFDKMNQVIAMGEGRILKGALEIHPSNPHSLTSYFWSRQF